MEIGGNVVGRDGGRDGGRDDGREVVWKDDCWDGVKDGTND